MRRHGFHIRHRRPTRTSSFLWTYNTTFVDEETILGQFSGDETVLMGDSPISAWTNCNLVDTPPLQYSGPIENTLAAEHSEVAHNPPYESIPPSLTLAVNSAFLVHPRFQTHIKILEIFWTFWGPLLCMLAYLIINLFHSNNIPNHSQWNEQSSNTGSAFTSFSFVVVLPTLLLHQISSINYNCACPWIFGNEFMNFCRAHWWSSPCFRKSWIPIGTEHDAITHFADLVLHLQCFSFTFFTSARCLSHYFLTKYVCF